MADLHIPDAAKDELYYALDQLGDGEDATGYVRLIAGPVVAAELRRLAGEMRLSSGSLLDRADELDPPQSGGDPA